MSEAQKPVAIYHGVVDCGDAGAIPLVEENTTGNIFENAIRRYGVVAACEWFGHSPDSDFTADTIKTLQERSNTEGGEG
jgi:hypothetical protein